MKIKWQRHKLVILLVSYWFMLLYITAGFMWWFVSLESQNKQMYHFRLEEIKYDDPWYEEKVLALIDARHRKTLQYIGEGATFLLVIMAGAFYIFRTARKELLISEQQQNFMMAVTHELKTPIAVTRLNLETMLKRKLEEAQQKRLISNSLEEVNRLNNLTNNILTTSQLETGAYRLNMQEINLTELTNNCIDYFHKRFPDRVTINQLNSNIFVMGEYQLLEMLLNNLLDNARKYSPKNQPITIALTAVHHVAELSISDFGEGISNEEKKKIFDKFYRIGSESTRSSKGTGLGLYLCRKIAKDHHGSLHITDHQPNGSTFTITVPLA